MQQAIAMLALVAGSLAARRNQRQAALAFGYGIVFTAFLVLIPSPAIFRTVGYAWWYSAWACYEALIILIAWKAHAPSSGLIIAASFVSGAMHLVTGFFYVTGPHLIAYALWRAHGWVCDGLESAQVAALFWYGPIGFAGIRIARSALRMLRGKKMNNSRRSGIPT
ncbi:MAG TPA: hypothetical protein VKA19_14435 [Alphaproteobacteria bacterium]|nr:hypothetical protein [Alphaproteobacteria bacterium]